MKDPNNQSDITDILGAAPSYKIDPEVQQNARNIALAAFRESKEKRAPYRQRNLLLAAVLVLTGLVAGLFAWTSTNSKNAPGVAQLPLTEASALLKNGRDLFGNNVRAIVCNQGDVNWVLGHRERQPEAPWYLVHFTDPTTQNGISVVAMSGSRFFIEQEREVEILEGLDGRFIITLGDLVIDPETVTANAIML